MWFFSLLCFYCCYSETTIDYQNTYQVVKWFGSLYGKKSSEPDLSRNGLEFLKSYKSINSSWYAISSFKCVALPSSIAVAVIRNLLSTIKTLIRLLSNLVAFTGGTQVHLISQDTGLIFSKPTNQSTDPNMRFQVSSVLPFPPLLSIAVAVSFSSYFLVFALDQCT